jgi:hypothetical protein
LARRWAGVGFLLFMASEKGIRGRLKQKGGLEGKKKVRKGWGSGGARRWIRRLGGRESRPERFGEPEDLDLTPWPIEGVGIWKDQNRKNFNRPEFKCWSLDFTGASGEIWLPKRMRISRDIEIAVQDKNPMCGHE